MTEDGVQKEICTSNPIKIFKVFLNKSYLNEARSRTKIYDIKSESELEHNSQI